MAFSGYPICYVQVKYNLKYRMKIKLRQESALTRPQRKEMEKLLARVLEANKVQFSCSLMPAGMGDNSCAQKTAASTSQVLGEEGTSKILNHKLAWVGGVLNWFRQRTHYEALCTFIVVGIYLPDAPQQNGEKMEERVFLVKKLASH
ncbi:unnamed protein product [Sphenostylis stenocarpa]|uniref:Uncharacterized protein n=1 Tax=Sphenostylis stenocarpa TaxID=92480 RepID=A0AA86VGJ0_9FABA|nr:unnamed protein product [Sphenostylis stenocarpa]